MFVVISGIVFAVIYDFLNGMNDAANSIATIVSTKALRPLEAVAMSALFNLIGAFAFGVTVATTLGKGVVDGSLVTPLVVLSALVGASVWVHWCTRKGLPISVSHSLVGGLIGATLLHVGPAALISKGIIKVATFIALSPLIGMGLSIIFSKLTSYLTKKFSINKEHKLFRYAQILSAASFSLSHGTNDAQNTMGIISILLFSAGMLGSTFYVPVWVIVLSTIAMAAGTLAGGWKVIRTLGEKITNLRPIDGFCAETGGALTIMGATACGIPVSTTHTITGSIIGTGIANKHGVNLETIKRVVTAWILTIPTTLCVGGLSYIAFTLIFNLF